MYITLKETLRNKRYSQFDIWDAMILEDKMQGDKFKAFERLNGFKPDESAIKHYNMKPMIESEYDLCKFRGDVVEVIKETTGTVEYRIQGQTKTQKVTRRVFDEEAMSI